MATYGIAEDLSSSASARPGRWPIDQLSASSGWLQRAGRSHDLNNWMIARSRTSA